MTFSEKQILKKAIEKFGSEKQFDMLIEEMAELTQAILKSRRKGEISENLHEEFSDVKTLMEQIETILNPVILSDYRFGKIQRLLRLIKE
jgi:NTP pyrophosphatase (non-canonical NTP hydrolase)